MIAFVCASSVQVMRAVHMKMRYEICEDHADIFLVPMCAGYERIANNLKKLNLFSNVYIADTKDIKGHVVAHLLFGNNPLAKIIKESKYDKLFTFNIESEVGQAIFNRNRRRTGFEHHCVEDGPSIYEIYEPPRYKWYHPYKWVGIDKQAYHITNWWTSCPEFIEVPESFHTIKKRLLPIDVTDNEYIEAVNVVFDYETDEDLDMADILIMDESHYTDGLMIDNADYKFYEEIRKYYSDKKILVKLHPRTMHNRYAEHFQVMKKSNIPWELYVLNREQHNHKKLIQIGIVCITMLSDRLMFGIEGKKIILAPLFYDKIRASQGVLRVGEEQTQKYEMIKKDYVYPQNLVIAYANKDVYEALDYFFYQTEAGEIDG